MLLPFALAGGSATSSAATILEQLAIIPEASFIATFLFGIDELAIQLEEPFSILPLKDLCGQIDAALDQQVSDMRRQREHGS